MNNFFNEKPDSYYLGLKKVIKMEQVSVLYLSNNCPKISFAVLITAMLKTLASSNLIVAELPD